VIGEVWIVLKQNVIDTAVNERRNHLCACGHVIGWHFEHFLLQAVEKQTIGWTISPSDRNVENVYYDLFWLNNNAPFDKNTIFLFVLFSSGNAETDVGSGGKLNGHLMASCIRNILIKNY